MKAKKSYKKGGAIDPPKGRPGSKKKKKPIAGPGKAKKDMPFVRGRSEGFEPKRNMLMTEEGNFRRGPVGPTEEDYIRGERMARPDLDKIKPLQAKRIKNDAAMKAMVTSPKVRRSTATIPVPAKKKRRLRRK
tara:strand:+ start:95 stop:493 length:399 start_codon:yes stop_codon:yes gene_type:complete